MLFKKHSNPENSNFDYFSLGKNNPNEDSVLLSDFGNDCGVLAVADGVGGNPMGDLASRTATKTVEQELERNFEVDLPRVFARVLEEISKAAPNIPIATTLSVVRWKKNKFDVGHVGDTRVYHLRGFGLVTLTTDQNEGEELVRQGVLSKESIKNYPRRNVLISALSISTPHNLQILSGEAASGDRILATTDGVYDVVMRKEIAQLNEKSATPRELLNKIRELLANRGLKDDSSAACIQFS